MPKVSKKNIDKLIELIYTKECSGIQIDIFDISKVFNVGRKSFAENKSYNEIANDIKAFVETIRSD